MAAFPALILTNAGVLLQSKVQGGAALELTNIQMGSGQLNGQPIGPLTALISQDATVPIQGGKAVGQNTYQVSGFFTNGDLQAGFWWREIGVFANDPDNGEILYAYANAGDAGDYIPTVTDQRIEKYIYVSMALANAASVTVEIPQSDTFIPSSEKGQPDGVASLDETGKVPAAQLPDMDYIPNREKGAAGGVAPLGDDSKVPEQYLPEIGAPADGLPTNDVRSYPVREGESISAGDVVNVDSDVYHGVTAQANVEHVFYSAAVTYTDCIWLNEKYCVLAYLANNNRVALYDIETNKEVSALGLPTDISSVLLARLDDSHFVVQYLVNEDLRAVVVKLTGTNISSGSYTIVSPRVTESHSVIPISNALVLSIYNFSGLRAEFISVDGMSCTAASSVSILPDNTGSNYISATRISDDSNGNKRVCICFADISDGNKGKAVIATIDSSNAVTFGDVVTIRDSDCSLSDCIYADSLIMCLFGQYLYALNDSLKIQGESKTIAIGDQKMLKLLSINNDAILLASKGSSTTSAALKMKWTGTEFIEKAAFVFNNNQKALYNSGSDIGNNKMLIAYADTGNSNYGTTTILEVSGDQIAGSFVDNSKDAIALESGSGGDMIKIGFGGYCECPSVTANQEIVGAGDGAVSAISPQDGWLWIDPRHEYQSGNHPSTTHIYGVLWDGTSQTAMSRTDNAAAFVDPNPSVDGSGGSSPFDGLMPWAGMERVTDPEAGELVAIPKYWYKWTKSGNILKLQIADSPADGFFVSPAHCDRGDGKGERDVVYVGRYHCSGNYKSTTGTSPRVQDTRATMRSNIHSLGNTVYQWDLAMNWTIKMLYFVEFADWNSQLKIGYGCGNNSSIESMGYTDDMPYHTGTTQASRTTYGLSTQYRYIEGLWDNVYDWVDGCYYNNNGLNIILNPANFSDTKGGIPIGIPSNGYPTALDVSGALGNQWIFPTAADGSTQTYIPDLWDYYASRPCLYVGGSYGTNCNNGILRVGCNTESNSLSTVGSRLMKLP